ncbi:hypothetical protein V5799_023377 [Amblyomma americanum]|uniref:Secreted protein n=1 Tax=Amblyomma americanum TaxID=6943 RepID=A0AAQ4FIJ0_AMBAM
MNELIIFNIFLTVVFPPLECGSHQNIKMRQRLLLKRLDVSCKRSDVCGKAKCPTTAMKPSSKWPKPWKLSLPRKT